jgi:large conductance mechanosensitive channel
MRDLWNDFKKFLLRGNLVEIAVAFILGLYFKTVVDAFVNGIVMQIVAAIFGKPNFGNLTIGLGKSELFIGAFINAVVTFVIVAFVLFFMIKAFDAAKRVSRRSGEEDDEPLSREGELLQEIRDLLAAQAR